VTDASQTPPIGVLPGEGCGPELTRYALDMLAAASPPFQPRIEESGPIGSRAVAETGSALPPAVAGFCGSVFDRGGAILAGAGGERFVYEARSAFGLTAKLNPIHSFPELGASGRWRPADGEPVDIVVVRENLGGLYQGAPLPATDEGTLTIAFPTRTEDVAHVTSLAATLASSRRGRLATVTKEAGLPELHETWARLSAEAAATAGVELELIDVDVAAYLMLREPERFDVIVTSNCFGDILSDVGGHVMGSRGNTYGASYSPAGAAIYQTNHGCANDLAGTDTVNPAGQILSLAMLVRERFGWDDVADAITAAVRATWRAGVVTPDLAAPGLTVVGTREWMDAALGNVSEQLAWHPA
jgi:3-isopropylmalate dehydrogenase